MNQAWHASEQAPQDVVWERLQRRAAGRGRHSDSTAAMQRMQPRARVVIVLSAAQRARPADHWSNRSVPSREVSQSSTSNTLGFTTPRTARGQPLDAVDAHINNSHYADDARSDASQSAAKSLYRSIAAVASSTEPCSPSWIFRSRCSSTRSRSFRGRRFPWRVVRINGGHLAVSRICCLGCGRSKTFKSFDSA